MSYPADPGSLAPDDYILAILCAAIRQYSGQSGELRISRDELLTAVEAPIRLIKMYDETRKELVLSVGPNFSHAQVFTAKSTWQAERTQAAQLVPSSPPVSMGEQSLEGVRTTFSDPQQAEMERRAARLSDPSGRAREERARRVREQAAQVLEDLRSMQPSSSPSNTISS